jgi:hypothetical protein
MKKTIRIILALTLFMPFWLFMMFALLIFPGIIALGLGVCDIIGQCLKLLFQEGLTKDQRRDAAVSMEMSLSMIFIPLIVPVNRCYTFIKCGKIGIE